jgi:hypothetical protein
MGFYVDNPVRVLNRWRKSQGKHIKFEAIVKNEYFNHQHMMYSKYNLCRKRIQVGRLFRD